MGVMERVEAPVVLSPRDGSGMARIWTQLSRSRCVIGVGEMLGYASLWRAINMRLEARIALHT